MTLVTIGDSITKGTYTAPGEDSPNSIAKPYGEILSALLNYDFINYGFNGISYSKTSPINPEYSLESKIDDYVFGDITIVAAGTNDFGTNVDLKSFKTAVDNVLFSLKKRQKNEKIFVLSPLPRLDQSSNARGYSLDEYRRIIKTKTTEYNFIFIDGKTFDINPQDKTLIYDGVHLNSEAHKMLARYILEYIKHE